jgi:hypothetical protein
MKILATLLILLSLYAAAFADYIVKKSKNNICHLPGTTYYNQTKSYTAYKTLKDCLDSGGRLPKK